MRAKRGRERENARLYPFYKYELHLTCLAFVQVREQHHARKTGARSRPYVFIRYVRREIMIAGSASFAGTRRVNFDGTTTRPSCRFATLQLFFEEKEINKLVNRNKQKEKQKRGKETRESTIREGRLERACWKFEKLAD